MNDLKFAIRQLLKNPGFTAVAVFTLAMGIGANSAIFQILNAVRLKSLPVAKPSELIEIRIDGGNQGMGISDGSNAEMTYPLWEQLQKNGGNFASLFAWGNSDIVVGDSMEPRIIRSLWTSGDFFPVLGISPASGRLFNPEDDRRGTGPANVIISYAFWQSEFGGQDSAIGKSLKLNGKLFRVIGVTPRNFFGLEVGKSFDVALPLTTRALWWDNVLDRRDAWWLRVMGRLKGDATLAHAVEVVKVLTPGLLEATVPQGYRPEAGVAYRQFRLSAFPAGAGVSQLRSEYGRSLYLLLGITGLVLLIACVNLANLLLARAAARRHEIAVRQAIGASRNRMIGQLLTESMLLACCGAVCGALVARLLSGSIVWYLMNHDNSLRLDLSPDWRVLAFAFAVALLTCILFGLAPALRSTRVAPADALSAGRRVAGRREGFTLQRSLAVLQMAVSIVLLAGALLLVRSFCNLITLNPGFRQNGVFFAYVNFSGHPESRYPQLRQALLEQIRQIPQVQAAASTTHKPVSGGSWTMGVNVSGANGESEGWSKVTWASPGFFKTMEIPIISGRDFDEHDAATSPKVAIVNETFARRYLRDANPVGATLRTIAEPNYPEATYTIVGVIKDTVYGNFRDEIPPQTYAPASQEPNAHGLVQIAVSSSGPLPSVIAAVKQRAKEIDPGVKFGTSILRTDITETLVREQLLAWLSGFFGVIATLLVLVGLYGLVSYITLTRQNELGIRLALGAQPRDILRMVLNQGLRLALIGIPIGLLGAFALTRFLRGLLFGVAPTDMATLIGISLFLTAITALASWLPARRAAKVDPITALRTE